MTTKASAFANRLLDFLLNYIFQPTFFISLLGPIIIGNNFFKVIDYFKNSNADIISLSLNDYSYALVSYHIQYFVFILTFIFFIAEIFRVVSKIVPNWVIIKPRLHDGEWHGAFTKGLLILSAAVIISIVGCGFFDVFSHIDIDLYLKRNEIPFLFGDGFPPFRSPITWFRIIFAVLGILISRWELKVYPKLVQP